VGGPFLAVDVGGSSVKSAVVVDGEVTRYSKEPVAAGLDGLVAQLSRLYEGCGLAWGVCLPGLIDARTGTVHYSANLGMRDVAFLDELEAALPRPLVFENDLVAATVGEAAGGTLALLQLGTGIAARCAVDGAVPASAGGRAGEVGHLRFRDDGLPCACGRNGCVEAYAGWGGIRRRYEEAGREIASPAGVLRDAETDPWARELLDEALEAIGFAAAALVSAWDPGTLRLGGGVGRDTPGGRPRGAGAATASEARRDNTGRRRKAWRRRRAPGALPVGAYHQQRSHAERAVIRDRAPEPVTARPESNREVRMVPRLYRSDPVRARSPDSP
jgi:glucokinase